MDSEPAWGPEPTDLHGSVQYRARPVSTSVKISPRGLQIPPIELVIVSTCQFLRHAVSTQKRVGRVSSKTELSGREMREMRRIEDRGEHRGVRDMFHVSCRPTSALAVHRSHLFCELMGCL